MQTVERLRDDGSAEGDRESFAFQVHELAEMGERIALDVLHDDEELVLFGDDVERRDDVRVTDLRSEARFVEEHRDELGIARVAVVESFDRDRARKTGRSEQPTEMDRGHAARRDATVTRDNDRRDDLRSFRSVVASGSTQISESYHRQSNVRS